MGNDLEITSEVVDRQLTELTELFDLVETQLGPIAAAKERQGWKLWSSINECSMFAAGYSGALGEIERALREIQQSIGFALVNLRDNATNMANRDNENRERFTTLAKRLADATPPAPAPVAPSQPSFFTTPGSDGEWHAPMALNPSADSSAPFGGEWHLPVEAKPDAVSSPTFGGAESSK